ncbi:MAG: hypothetical protein BGO49_23400 [Planctomycetales bacterium 71-10]|nr:MAG: hypothetical protein BGO49_23400 [Planctomycetales bacterium 71-10]
MSTLVDTNILLRLIDLTAPSHHTTRLAIARLRSDSEELFIVPQNLFEFWAVATRPVAVNGLGKSVVEAAADLRLCKKLFTLLDDTPAVYPTWEHLVATAGVVGKKAHDARLVAAMMVHGVDRLLTFNVQDFRPYTGVRAQSPDEILAN